MRRAMTFALALVFALPLGLAHAERPECAPSAPGGDWPQFGQDVSGNRNQTAEHLIDAAGAARLAPVWTFDANKSTFSQNSEITSYPIVSNGCVYVGASTGQGQPGWVVAIDAEHGELVWRTKLPHGVYASLAVDDGKVFAFMSYVGHPTVVAMRQSDGAILWQKEVDTQPGSDAVSSPIVYKGMVWVGVSGTAAEADQSDRSPFQGSFALLDENTGNHPLTGGLAPLQTWTIPPDQWADGFAGGSIWSTMSVDPTTDYGYVGTGNPFNYDSEYKTTNAVLKIDLDKNRPTFGTIVDSYKGDVEEYLPEAENKSSCKDLTDAGVFGAGLDCARLDLDFGAQPNIFTDPQGRRLVGDGQKSGVYHVFDAETMGKNFNYKTLLGVPSPVGGIVGSAAIDATNIYGPHTIGSYLWSIKRDNGAVNWVSPVPAAVNWGPPVTLANKVLYTVDLRGFLDAFDAATGLPLLSRPMEVGADTHADPTFTWGAATVARGRVFASVGVGLTSAGLPSMPNGFVIAFAPTTVQP